MAYIKTQLYFSGSNSLTDMNNNYHLDLYINDTLISAESEINDALHPNGSTNNPDKIEYRCKTGYAFSGDVYGHIKNTEGTQLRPLMSVTNNTSAVYNVSQGNGSSVRIYPDYKGTFNSGGVYIPYCTVVATGASYQLTKNLTNASVTPNINTVTAGVSYTLDINANEGYTFDENNTPSFYYIDNEGDPYYLPVTKIDDTHYRITFTADETDYIIDASAIALPATTPIDITGLTNCHISPNILAVTVGVTTQIDVVADSGYYFDENDEPILYIPYDDEGGQTTVNGTRIDETTYRFSVTTDEYDIKLEFVADAMQIPETVALTKNLTNCSLSPNISALVLNQTYNLIITANAGYRFDVAPSLRFTNDEGTIIYYESVKVSNYEYRFNNVSAESGERNFILTATANAESQTSEKYGVLAIHKITADNLKAINDLRYYSGGSSLSQIDLSQYFASLKVIYCDVTTQTSDNIIVSNVNTNIVAPKVTDDYTILNLGNVSLAGEYLNALDKKYSEITLNLPFVSAYKLDSAFMNETINIKYRVHLISGDVTVIISLVRNDTEYLIDTISGNMSFDLPFTYTINGETKPINANVNNPINFNVAPSVTIRQRLKADIYNSVYQCYKIDTPAHENGYFKIERLDADTIPASASIRNKIENLLKAGVYN